MTKSVLLVSGCQWENKQNLKNSKQSKEKELFYSEENPLKADSYLYTSEAHRKIWAWHLALWRGSRQRRLLVLAGEQAFSPPRHQLQGLQAVLHYGKCFFLFPGFGAVIMISPNAFPVLPFPTLVVVSGVEKSPVQTRRAVYCTTSPPFPALTYMVGFFSFGLLMWVTMLIFDWTALHNCNNSRSVMLENSFMYRCIWTILYTCPNIERK